MCKRLLLLEGSSVPKIRDCLIFPNASAESVFISLFFGVKGWGFSFSGDSFSLISMSREVFLFLLSGYIFSPPSFGFIGETVLDNPVFIPSKILLADFIESNRVDVVSLFLISFLNLFLLFSSLSSSYLLTESTIAGIAF